jgi:hypothetical protein
VAVVGFYKPELASKVPRAYVVLAENSIGNEALGGGDTEMVGGYGCESS